MKFFSKILTTYRNYKREFFSINQIELTGFSKLLMILFFFTSLWLIANGIQSSIHQNTPVEVKYGYKCENFAQMSNFRLYDFQKTHSNYHDIYDEFGTALECKQLKQSYQKILNNQHIQSQITQSRLLEDKLQMLNAQTRRLKSQYDTMLLEKISHQSQDKSILKANADNIKIKLQKLSQKKHQLSQKLTTMKDVLNYPNIQDFILLRDKLKDTIISNISHDRKFYRLKTSIQIFAFVIPIWLIFFWFYRFLTKKNKYIFAKLSFYVSSAAALYGLVELVQLIYSIIPKLFLAKLIAFFSSHNMIIVLNVIGILFFLSLFGIIIHKIQHNQAKKRLYKDTKILNVKRQSCFNCGTKRDQKDEYCGFCGEKLKQKCILCKHEIYRYAPYCTVCGKKQDIEA